HEDDIGLHRSGLGQRLSSRAALADQHHVRSIRQDECERISHNGVVVDCVNAKRALVFHHVSRAHETVLDRCQRSSEGTAIASSSTAAGKKSRNVVPASSESTSRSPPTCRACSRTPCKSPNGNGAAAVAKYGFRIPGRRSVRMEDGVCQSSTTMESSCS